MENHCNGSLCMGFAKQIRSDQLKKASGTVLLLCKFMVEHKCRASTINEGLLKVTRNKMCECLRFSILSSLVSITHLSICLLANYNFYHVL